MHKSKKNHKFGEHRGFSSDLCLIRTRSGYVLNTIISCDHA